MNVNTQTRQGSVFGGVMLISGCCIGAGMLGLPVLSSFAGFIPSLCILVLAWLYMVFTGLLVLEVNLHFTEEVNIVSMAQKTLGAVGKWIAWTVFLLLFYCLMVAYTAGGGALLSEFVLTLSGKILPDWIGSLVCALVLGIFLYCGTRTTDIFNRILMAGLMGSYVALVLVATPHVTVKNLAYQNWNPSLGLLPIMIVSFGYHNLVPSLATYMNRNAQRLKSTIWIGSFITFIVYVIWETIILGVIPIEGAGGLQEALEKGEMATQALQQATGNSLVVEIAIYFAFFALITSFLGVGLSFIDFLADGLRIKKDNKGRLLLCAFVILPSLFFAFLYPGIFLVALNFAGGVGAVILFGLLPAAMVWSGRYRKKLWDDILVPGGKPFLLLIMLFSCAVMMMQLIGW